MTCSRFSLFLTAFILGSAIAAGQSTSIGFSIGPTISDLRVVDGSSFLKDIHEPRIGVAAEANFTWRFAKNFGVRTGLGFERKGAKSDITFTDENGNPTENRIYRTNLDYLQVPLLLEARWGNKASWLFNIGQSYGLLVHHNEDIRLNTEFIKTDWSILAGIGFELPMTESISIQVQTRAAYGLNELVKEGFWETKNISAIAIVGLQYFLN